MKRAAYLIALLSQRAVSVGDLRQKTLYLPINQQHLADTLGLSIVHTDKTLRKPADRQLIWWLRGLCKDGLDMNEWWRRHEPYGTA